MPIALLRSVGILLPRALPRAVAASVPVPARNLATSSIRFEAAAAAAASAPTPAPKVPKPPKSTSTAKSTATKSATVAEKKPAAKKAPAAKRGRPAKKQTAEEKEAEKAAKKAKAEKDKARAVKEKAKEKAKAQRELLAGVKMPKYAPSAYVLFFQDFFAANKHKYINDAGKCDLPQISRDCSAAWAKLSLLETDKYTAAAKARRAQWETEYRQFYESLSPEQKRAYQKKIGRKLAQPAGIKREQQSKPGFPGRPSSAFFELLADVKPELQIEAEKQGFAPGIATNSYIAKQAGERWRSMTDEQKKVYTDRLKARKEKYEAWLAAQPKE